MIGAWLAGCFFWGCAGSVPRTVTQDSSGPVSDGTGRITWPDAMDGPAGAIESGPRDSGLGREPGSSDRGALDRGTRDRKTGTPDLPAATCTDGKQNGDESDTDCGGSCAACANGRKCLKGADCSSKVCLAGICQAWLSAAHKYRVPVTVTNPGAALTSYQVLVSLGSAALVSAGKLRSDCGDLRATDADKTTSLPLWLESGCNTATTRVWVKVPALASSASRTIFLYYGNPTATSASNFSTTFSDPNGDFETDAAGTSKSAISSWNHVSGTVGESGDIDWPIVAGSTPCAEDASLVTARRQAGTRSFRSQLKNCNTGGNSDKMTRAAVQRLSTEPSYRGVASGASITVWMSETAYTTAARWRWLAAVTLSDGAKTDVQRVVCKDWGNHEGCGTTDAYDKYDQSAAGADGQTWKRYTITIASGMSRTGLTITLSHLQDTWDGASAESTIHFDSVGGYRLRKYRAPEPTTAVGTEQAS